MTAALALIIAVLPAAILYPLMPLVGLGNWAGGFIAGVVWVAWMSGLYRLGKRRQVAAVAE
jgi:hypothetical protein